MPERDDLAVIASQPQDRRLNAAAPLTRFEEIGRRVLEDRVAESVVGAAAPVAALVQQTAIQRA
jgi:hypothetical protein